MRVRVWSDFQKKTNSTKKPTTSGTEMQGYLRNSDPFSLFSPIINFELQDKTQPPLWTYMYIPEFNRYYWIVDWIHNEGVWSAYTAVDVLASYKDEIGNTDMYVLRASNMFDSYVVDTKYPITTNLLEYTDNSSSVWVQTPGTQQAILDPNFWYKYLPEGCFVLSVYGPNVSGITTYFMNYQGFKNFAQKLYDFTITASGFWDQIPEAYAKAIADPLQFVADVKWYPTLPITQFGTEDITLGYYTLDNIDGVTKLESNIRPIVYYKSTFTVRKHPQESRGEYLNTAPYSNYKLRIPPFGEFDLDSARLTQCNTIEAEWYVDYQAGKGKLFINGVNSNQYRFYLGGVEATFGVEIPLNQNTMNISSAANTSALIWGTVGALQGMRAETSDANIGLVYDSEPVSIFGKEFNIPNIQVNTGSSFKDIASAALGGFMSYNPGLSPHLSTVGGVASFIDYMSGVPAAIISTFYYIVEEDPDNIGKPLCMVKKPKDLGGYLLVENPKITTLGTITETQQIKDILTGGFFYE